MDSILITGASGNVGSAALKSLSRHKNQYACFIADRYAAGQESSEDQRKIRKFDFLDASSWPDALKGINKVFLLRPPKIADVDNIFVPLIRSMEKTGVQSVVFLSVQGADKMSWVPHYKIERALESSSLDYIFIRPSYFMQNLITTLSEDIIDKKEIHLPAGNALFNWVDVDDIGKAIAYCLTNFAEHKNQSFTISGPKNMSFTTVVEKINQNFHLNLRYIRRSPIGFLFYKIRKGTPFTFAMIQLILHYLPRFSKEPEISSNFKQITGEEPTPLEAFLNRTESFWLKLK